MLTKLLKNIFGAFVSLLLISSLIFFLSKLVPGDQILSYLNLNSDSEYTLDFEREYGRKARELNQDKALFYFSVLPSNFPKNLNQTLIKRQRRWERKLLFEGYDYDLLRSFWSEAVSTSIRTKDTHLRLAIKNEVLNVHGSNQSQEISNFFSRYDREDEDFRKLRTSWNNLSKNKRARIFPRLHYHGLNNQYHLWISNFSKGNLGVSILDQKAVKDKIQSALIWTLFLVLFSLFLSYFLGILIGLLLSYANNQRLVNLIERFLFGFYSIPVFWLATILLVFFTSSEYGKWTNIFPSVGLAPIDLGESWFVKIANFGKQLILPVFCLVMHNLAFVASLTKRNLNKSRKLSHILTAKAYGYNESEILFRDVFPHTLLPLITSVSASIPAAIGGSLIIEIIYNIPGMGRLLYSAILNYDWPVVFSVTMFIAVITIITYLIADLLYQFFDPRIKEK